MSNVIPLREIRTKDDALLWGDEWEVKYRAFRQSVWLEVRELQDALMFAQVDLTIERGDRLIERIALEDEIKRLRSLLD